MGTIDKKEAHKVFGEVWKMFNTVRKNDTDDGWKEDAGISYRGT